MTQANCDYIFTDNNSFSSVLFYAIPNGGPFAMVWGVSFHRMPKKYCFLNIALFLYTVGNCLSLHHVHRVGDGRARVIGTYFWWCMSSTLLLFHSLTQ
jgi:hypothetical protein